MVDDYTEGVRIKERLGCPTLPVPPGLYPHGPGTRLLLLDIYIYL